MTSVGINGYGRMGRLAMRILEDHDNLEVVAVNEPGASADTMALLTAVDSVHGAWGVACQGEEGVLWIDGREVVYTSFDEPAKIPWSELGVDLVLDCSGEFRDVESLMPHLNQGARRVVVSAPVKGGAANIVMGVNDDDPALDGAEIVSAASCTTNCLAPIVSVLHEELGIERGAVTTLHAPTNTQRVHDGPHRDQRRARATLNSMIPTTTNSAYAVTMILPELEGRLTSVAVRVPVMNASLVDANFQVARDTTVDEVNAILKAACDRPRLRGILGYEARPLVSADYATEPRSAVVDAGMTRVVDGRMLKVMAWYDNEWGYANRLVELADLVAQKASE
ncbi:MAG: type I glyceraldehyde-3-phosphate dehydrogenase [Deltaproteobacteria bacterium]|nr:type I glyceraldehyde-3-phosphate dehydrogenase [Deltaproteobacteria bacterium]